MFLMNVCLEQCRYDAERAIARLQDMWVSAASATQRRGRAGRVRPGVCYKMFSRKQASVLEVCSTTLCFNIAVCSQLSST